MSKIDWVERLNYLGGSDIGSVAGIGDFACPRKTAYEKLSYEKDFDSSDKMEFRRGHRQEPVAIAYLKEKNPEYKIFDGQNFRKPGAPHIGANADFILEIPGREGRFYGEVKVLGKFSFAMVKRDGLFPSYIAQVQQGMNAAGLKQGMFVIFCPDEDELLQWEFKLDQELADQLEETGTEFWQCHIQTKILPPPLPEIKNVCIGCDFRKTCRGSSDLSQFKEKKPRKTKEKV